MLNVEDRWDLRLFWASIFSKLKSGAFLALLVLPSLMVPSLLTPANAFSQEPEVESNSTLLESVNKMDRVLAGEESERDPLRDRLVAVALIGGAFLALLGVLFFYLRVDHASRGFYSGKLQMASLIAVAIILLVSYLLWVGVMFK